MNRIFHNLGVVEIAEFVQVFYLYINSLRVLYLLPSIELKHKNIQKIIQKYFDEMIGSSLSIYILLKSEQRQTKVDMNEMAISCVLKSNIARHKSDYV